MPNGDVIPASVRRVPAVQEDPNAQIHPDDVAALDAEDEISGLQRVVSEIGGDDDQAKVIVWRLNPQNPRAPLAWLDEISPAQFSIKWLADTYGGGLFNVRVFVPQVDKDGNKLANGRVKCAANKRVFLEGPAKIKRYDTDEPARASAPASDTASIVAAIMKSNENVLAAIQAGQHRPADPFDQIEKLLKLKMLFSDGAPKSSGMDQFKEMFGMWRELEETKAAAGSDNSLGPLLLLADKFFKRFDQLPAAPAPQLPGPAAPAAGEAENREPHRSGEVVRIEGDEMFEKQMFKLYIDMLINKAKNRVDPKIVAVEVVSEADTKLFGFLKTDTWFDEVVKLNPDAALYKLFFTALRDEVIRLADANLNPGGPA